MTLSLNWICFCPISAFLAFPVKGWKLSTKKIITWSICIISKYISFLTQSFTVSDPSLSLSLFVLVCAVLKISWVSILLTASPAVACSTCLSTCSSEFSFFFLNFSLTLTSLTLPSCSFFPIFSPAVSSSLLGVVTGSWRLDCGVYLRSDSGRYRRSL